MISVLLLQLLAVDEIVVLKAFGINGTIID